MSVREIFRHACAGFDVIVRSAGVVYFLTKKLLVSDTVYLDMLNVFLLNSRSEPSDVGMLSLAAFLQFWGVVFLATTVVVCFFKAEVGDGVNYKVVGLLDTYRQVKLGFALCRSL